jgi:hypothetical protein
VLIVLPSALWLGVALLVGALPSASFNVIINNHIYAVTPDRLLGRVGSSARLVAWGTIPLGTLAGGIAADTFGSRTALVPLAGLMLVAAATLAASRGIREISAPPQPRGVAVS